MNETLLQWQNGQLLPVEAQASERLLLLDSFAVRGGKVAAVDLHCQRFADGVAALAPAMMSALSPFWQAVVDRLDNFDAFPRVELVARSGADQALRLRIRPLGQLASTARVLIGETGDTRRQPRLKGADLAQCQAWQAAAQAQGFDEYLIRDAQGMPLEGAYSALLWWEGDVLCAPPEDAAAILLSVTRRVLWALAARYGVPTAVRWPTLAELQSYEVWLANARHGLRVVTGWSDGNPAITQAARRERWQKLWLDSARILGKTFV